MPRQTTENRVTLKDIAKRLGISYQAVAAALNSDGSSKLTSRVSKETAERVRKMAQEMNYRKSPGASLLRGRRSHMVGLILDSETPLEFVEIKMLSILGMERVLARNDYKLTIIQENLHEVSSDTIPSYVTNHEHDAFVVFSFEEGRDESLFQIFRKYRIPALDFNGRQDNFNVMATDDIQGSLLATEHLIGLGHQRILFVGMNTRHHSSVRRYESFAEIMKGQGLEAPCCWLGDAGKIRPREQYSTDPDAAIVRHLLKAIEEHRPTALYCKNDKIAWMANRVLRDQGLSVPRDISIVGTNDLPGTNFCIPPLTTIHFDFEKMGEKGAEAILSLIDSSTQRRRFPPIQPELVVRESTAPPAEVKSA